MDLVTAILFGELVKAAEDVNPSDLTNAQGRVIPVSYGTAGGNYTVVSTFYGNDLATDLNPGRATQIVSFGLILKGPGGDVVVAIRGTEEIWEWIHDADFLSIKCPFLAGAGKTEDGFTNLYQSLRMTADPTSTRLVDELKALPNLTGKVAICGHSLGGALATLLALDVAANTPFKNPAVFTYASPRTGDSLFASTYNQLVPNTTRIAHRVDVVPKLPTPPVYEHVNTAVELNSLTFTPLPHLLVKPDILCAHHLTTYLNLLSRQAGGPVLALNPECVPPQF